MKMSGKEEQLTLFDLDKPVILEWNIGILSKKINKSQKIAYF